MSLPSPAALVRRLLPLLAVAAAAARAATPALPDFALGPVILSAVDGDGGRWLTVSVTVRNQGSAAGDARHLDLWYNHGSAAPVVGDVGDWWSPVGRLAAGESRVVTAPARLVTGNETNRLHVGIDFEDVTSETDNGNNSVSLLYQAGTVITVAWDDGYVALGNGWRRLAWFGDYAPMGDGWIWHNKHGFLYVAPQSTPQNVMLFAQDLAWLWTSAGSYPYLYRFSDGAWLWYNGSTNPRWFNNLTAGRWESWP